MQNNPQTELGHVKIATGDPGNDVLSALGSAQLSGLEYQVVLFVIRKTWGFNKKEGWISLHQFHDFTGRSIEGICKAIKAVERKNIIHIRKVLNKPSNYTFNKDFKSWKGVYYSTGVNTSTGLNKSTERPALLNGVGLNKSTYTKANVQKQSLKQEPDKKNYSDEDYALQEKQFSAICVSEQWCDIHYVDKTIKQLHELRHENRMECYRKIRVCLNSHKSSGVATRRLAKKLFHEIAGFVNDHGAMERVLDGKELEERRKFAEEESGQRYVHAELDSAN